MENTSYAHGEQPPAYNAKGPQPQPQMQPQPQPYGGYAYPAQPQGAVVMVAPGTQVMNAENQVQDNMVISIVSIFFCCLLGIIATVKASNSRDALKRGDIAEAKQQATSARKLAKAAIIIGCICVALSIFSGIISAVVNASSSTSSRTY